MKVSNKKHKGRGMRRFRNTILVFVLIIIAIIVYFNIATKISPPEITDMSILEVVRENPSPDFYKIDNCWLRKNKYGLWEMYLEGSPFEIGVINGKLTKELIKIQEDAFVVQINTLIPSKSYLKFLKYFISWFNRDIDSYIPKEYLREIYGVSFSASDDYDLIGNNYERMLNYHGAHDIGHALQSLALVGCTSFASNIQSEDSSMIIGRNFDFYINETFAENKIVAFINPDNGYKFMYVTWASMIGVVSGMNEKGLTVTINAANSDIPTKAAMPISLLTREILQYAGNIDEAIDIASKRQIFVSESIMVSSAVDKNAVIIEKSPSTQDVYSTNANNLVCSNHFQSDAFTIDLNDQNENDESVSEYRKLRCEQLIAEKQILDYMDVAEILRDYSGLNDKNIGIGNEKTMAQMISHHSIIFLPEKLNTWVSTFPFQFGDYLSYNLNHVLNEATRLLPNTVLYDSDLNIPSSPFLTSGDFQRFIKFKRLRNDIKKIIDERTQIINEEEFIDDFINCNPEYYQVWVLAGDYYYNVQNYRKALLYYQESLTKEFENAATKSSVKEKVKNIEREI